jgi:PAS domain S-box-containing protein
MPGKSHLTDTHLFFQKEAVSVNDMDALFNAYEDFLFVLDCNGDILHTNRIVTEKLGYSFDELQNRSVLFLHPSERHEEVGHIIKRMFEGKETVCKIPLQTKTAKLIFVETKVTWGNWQGNKCIIGVSRDVNERRKAEEKLRESEMYYRTLTESNPDTLFVLDKDGFFIDYKADRKNLFKEPEQFIGRHYSEILPNEVSGKLDAAIVKALRQKTAGEITYSMELGNDIRYFSARIVPLKGDKQFLFVRDISEQIASKELLISQNSLQNILIKIASDYINVPLSDMEVAINKSLKELGEFVGADRSYIFMYDWEKQVCNNTYEWCEDGISRQNDNLQNISIEEIPNWVDSHTKGETIVISDVLALSENDGVRAILEPQGVKSLITIPMMENGACVGFIGFDSVNKHHRYTKNEKVLLMVFSDILVNIKQREKLEKSLLAEKQRAEAASYAKSEFLANVSHEIRTPMNAILGFSEALYHKLEHPHLCKMVKSVLKSGNLLLSLLNDILDLSKIESDKIEIIYQPVDILSIIDDVNNLFKEKAYNKGVALTVNILDSIPDCLLLDEIRIKQIVFNLVGNAVKFTQKGYIVIEVSFTSNVNGNGELIIDVVDTGIGIPEEQQELVFESFQQQSGQVNVKYEGVGLGLAISRRLARKMGGNVSVKSKKAVGSTFRLAIPNVVRCREETAKRETIDDYDKVTFDNSTLLVVDDVVSNILIIKSFLEESGVSILSAGSGKAALKLLKKKKPDIILLDIRMQDMNGYEVAERIKRISSLRNIPLIAYTTKSSKELTPLPKNFDGSLTKPVRRSVLFNELMKYLKYRTEEKKKKAAHLEVAVAPVGELSDQVKAKLPELLDLLEGRYMEEWEKIKNLLVIYKIELFAKELAETAKQYNYKFLREYSDQLSHYINIIDLDLITDHIARYPKFVEHIRRYVIDELQPE